MTGARQRARRWAPGRFRPVTGRERVPSFTPRATCPAGRIDSIIRAPASLPGSCTHLWPRGPRPSRLRRPSRLQSLARPRRMARYAPQIRDAPPCGRQRSSLCPARVCEHGGRKEIAAHDQSLALRTIALLAGPCRSPGHGRLRHAEQQRSDGPGMGGYQERLGWGGATARSRFNVGYLSARSPVNGSRTLSTYFSSCGRGP